MRGQCARGRPVFLALKVSVSWLNNLGSASSIGSYLCSERSCGHLGPLQHNRHSCSQLTDLFRQIGWNTRIDWYFPALLSNLVSEQQPRAGTARLREIVISLILPYLGLPSRNHLRDTLTYFEGIRSGSIRLAACQDARALAS